MVHHKQPLEVKDKGRVNLGHGARVHYSLRQEGEQVEEWFVRIWTLPTVRIWMFYMFHIAKSSLQCTCFVTNL